eukprot:NODE_5482_length_696_cov_32.574692_g5459_i0.p1 GENE.NODE_5482_length_696_cov_32.574692_g5459_i0~~NODE_5482_length_696_cov_32.574692_g5459_i0.p1  ORF type:complete len:169 (-),score=74.94 NODE_5482_length_696_cov_32.574692_g5459_i0:188-628(-)
MAEEQTLREAFDLHDHQGAKKISADELGGALRAVGKRLTNANVQRLTEEAQADLGGSLTFAEFTEFVKKASEIEKRDEDIKQAFQVFDSGDEKGQVDVKELKHALTTLGDKLTLEQVDTFLADAGFDPSQKTVHFDKFMALLQANV